MAERKTDEETMMSIALQTTAPLSLQACIRLALAAAAIALVAALAIGAGSANAETGITEYSTSVSTTQAGGHPDVSFHALFENPRENFPPCHCDDAQQIAQHFPTGFIGNPHVAAECTAVELLTGTCPVESQVGTYSVTVLFDLGYGPLYNMETQPDQAGLTGFMVPLVAAPAMTELSARTDSDYGLDAVSPPIFHILPLTQLTVRLWGVPSDPIHDNARFFTPQKELANCFAPYPEPCAPEITTAHSNLPPKPYIESPTACGVPLTTSMDVSFYSGATAHADGPWPSTTGCDQLAFDPSLTAQPTTTQADTSSGLDIDIKVPQTQSPTTPSPSEIRATTVTLPKGFSLTPNGSDGKEACTDAQARLGTREGAQCPEASKVGTVELDSSALPGPIPGAIYIGTPEPDQTFRIILTADGFGTHVKLPGVTDTDPQTGQLVAKFVDLPQSPFQDFKLHFFGSERGIFSTPNQCGTYPVVSEFVPWDSVLPNQTSTSFFKIDSGPNGKPCPDAKRPFSPRLAAGTTNSTAGRHAPFVLDVNRDDGEQNLVGIGVTTPPGLSGSLRGIPYCPEAALAQLAEPTYHGIAELAAPACPAASRIGTTTAATGSGTHPIFNTGELYLAGPYKGAPLSLVAVVPAVSGPYDLGNVAVRTAIYVDPITAQLSAVSDPIPTILGGVPLRVRSILVNLDRPNFMLNPTNCEHFQVEGSVIGDEGSEAKLSVNYQVANCARLPFAPKLVLKLTGSTKQGDNPALTATLTAKPGEANISRTQVTLPPAELVDNAHINTICTRVQFNEGKTPGEKCPPGSILGFAKADTPLLEEPLEGPIYLRATGRAGLPDIVAALNGQIGIVLDGRVDSVHGGLRTTFETVPDAPLTKVVLSFDGGRKGLLENSPRLCAHAQHFTAVMTGQNGKTTNRSPVLRTPCGKKHKRTARAHHNRRAH